LSKAIAYILNPEKTDEKLLVSSYGCASETAAREFEWTRRIAGQKGMNPVRIIARHVIQSFEIGEVTPELAHEIGKQFADEILGGKYEYVLTTHIDKDHVHNHLIFNAVDFVDYHAYKSYKRIYYDMREVSDRLCKENGLSVIPPSQNKGMSYKEYTEAKRGTSWKQKLKQTIDRLVITAKDYDDFLRLMQEAGYEINTSPSALKVRSGLPVLRPSERTTPRNASRSGLPDGRPEEVRDRPRRRASLSSEIFRSGSGLSTARVMSIKQSSLSSRKRHGRSTISQTTTCSNTPILRRRSRMFTAPMIVPARS